MADCAGLWRRTLLVDTDGSTDTTSRVRWLQGITGYVDSRGFAGVLEQRGDVFEWQRLVATEPSGSPDAGRMSWEGNTLVEVGLHADYIEHWVRDESHASPCWSLVLQADDGQTAVLVRVGNEFGWADGHHAVIGTTGGQQWAALAPRRSGDELTIDGVRWHVKMTEGEVEL
ncbi:hypothetical protein H7J87_04895 [Mycolicibacterium wolinskyi]|uniref:Uncharacterized protein n=1 Tax=Mycolicibacterium wolinskyi TaxID=59750 RepID=A0A1X2FH51_9MYCO|nr:hypothetical protein [Mycolicibacterium wolinskyi]MCV7295222.1 hypothetical protein [Mycolicibacterium goodii]ORX17780.1 hypothetical protein AWC31_15225 [Mycolicibacterium wolinskyi]